MSTISFQVLIPKSCWWTSNDRIHHMKAYRLSQDVLMLAKRAAIASGIGAQSHVSIKTEVHYLKGTGRADPHNVGGAVEKPVIDALVAAGIIPDDNPNHLTHNGYTRGPNMPDRHEYALTLHITPTAT